MLHPYELHIANCANLAIVIDMPFPILKVTIGIVIKHTNTHNTQCNPIVHDRVWSH